MSRFFAVILAHVPTVSINPILLFLNTFSNITYSDYYGSVVGRTVPLLGYVVIMLNFYPSHNLPDVFLLFTDPLSMV